MPLRILSFSNRALKALKVGVFTVVEAFALACPPNAALWVSPSLLQHSFSAAWWRAVEPSHLAPLNQLLYLQEVCPLEEVQVLHLPFAEEVLRREGLTTSSEGPDLTRSLPEEVLRSESFFIFQ